MVVTVTLNAAVDKTYIVGNFALDRVHRPSTGISVAGGKGINVARVLGELGRDVLATGFVGGCNGNYILSSLDREQLKHNFVHTVGESRLCIAIVDPDQGTQTEVNESGAEVSYDEVGQLRDKLLSLMDGIEYLVMSGSAPPGVPDEFYADIIREAEARGIKTVLDSSGEHLRCGAKAGPYMIKPNAVELSALVGRELLTLEETLQAAKDLTRFGVKVVSVSMGRAGAIVTDGTRSYKATPPDIKFVSAGGSGDAFVAAFIHSLMNDEYKRQAVRLGTAAGASNAGTVGAGFCRKEDMEKLAEEVVVTPLS